MVTNVAIIGYGIVGKATHEVLLDHINVEIHDPERVTSATTRTLTWCLYAHLMNMSENI